MSKKEDWLAEIEKAWVGKRKRRKPDQRAMHLAIGDLVDLTAHVNSDMTAVVTDEFLEEKLDLAVDIYYSLGRAVLAGLMQKAYARGTIAALCKGLRISRDEVREAFVKKYLEEKA